jgi:hypothetical protein
MRPSVSADREVIVRASMGACRLGKLVTSTIPEIRAVPPSAIPTIE